MTHFHIFLNGFFWHRFVFCPALHRQLHQSWYENHLFWYSSSGGEFAFAFASTAVLAEFCALCFSFSVLGNVQFEYRFLVQVQCIVKNTYIPKKCHPVREGHWKKTDDALRTKWDNWILPESWNGRGLEWRLLGFIQHSLIASVKSGRFPGTAGICPVPIYLHV